MDTFQDAHYFSLPTQGNVYSLVNLALTDGSNKTLVSILKRKVFCCEFLNDNEGLLKPIVKEVPFTYIPAGAEIISIDAFNRSPTHDDFFIGIAIIKVSSDQSSETYLNVYTEQDVEERTVLNLENIAQNCLISSELSFTPYQLYHTFLINENLSKEVVWLLSGSDVKVHLFREDPQNHTYSETDQDELFPEFMALPSIILSMDVKVTDDLQTRITAFGCECGILKVFVVNCLDSSILRTFYDQYDAAISRVHLFSFTRAYDEKKKRTVGPEAARIIASYKRNKTDEIKSSVNLLVVNSLQPSIIFMDVFEKGLSDKNILPESDKHDATLCCSSADIDMDGKNEILLGTYSQVMLIYKYDTSWCLIGQHRFSHALHAINYADITGDGVNELIVVTMAGIHIFQHNPQKTFNIFKRKLEAVRNNLLSETNGEITDELSS